MKWRQPLATYLRYSKKERIGILTIIVLILLICLLPLLSAKNEEISIQKDDVLLAAIDTLKIKQTRQSEEEPQNELAYQYEPSVKSSYQKNELFKFDPNILSGEGWKRLGLNDRIIRTINNYRNKGGKFYKAEDLQKIWGLPQGFYNHVKDYISIQPSNIPTKNYPVALNSKPEKRAWNIELNTADTSALIELPGIGSKLALRIINFRDKLGGFYSVDQIGETYGLSDSVFRKIKPYLHVNGEIKKLNINTATKDELKQHPYIKGNLANLLVEYRNQHGNYKSVEDLKNIAAIDETTFRKLSPYLYL